MVEIALYLIKTRERRKQWERTTSNRQTGIQVKHSNSSKKFCVL